MASATVAFNAIVVEALNEHNYRDWSSQIETYLLAKDIWDVVKAETPETENGEAELYWRRKDAKALHAIKICCGKEAFSFIRESSTAKIAWEVLEMYFNSPTSERDEEGEIWLHTTTHDAGQTQHLEEESVGGEDLELQASDGGNENSDILKRFFGYVKDGDVENIMELLGEPPHALLRAIDPENGCTGLHRAVSYGYVSMVEKFVTLMLPEDLEIKETTFGNTALHIAVHNGNSDIVRKLLAKMRQQSMEEQNMCGETALHIAAQVQNLGFSVEDLLCRMSPEDLQIRDREGYTALDRFLINGSDHEANLLRTVHAMINKNSILLVMNGPPYGHIPVVEACAWSRWELCHYLYSVTPFEALLPRDEEDELMNGSQGAQLLNMCIRHPKGLDIACDLLRRSPRLAFVRNAFGSYPMLVLARLHYAFLCGRSLTFWQNWMYNCTYVPTEDDPEILENHISSMILWRRHFYMVFRRFINGFVVLLGYNHLFTMKSIHLQALSCMGYMTRNKKSLAPVEQTIVKDSVLKAIEHGHFGFVFHMCKAYPGLVDTNINNKSEDLFQHAIECRQAEIYSFIYGLKKERRNEIGQYVADFRDSLLHVAAKYSSLTRSNQDASLQMQTELQWFKAVESILPFETHEYLDRKGLTARELFTDNHADLKEKAEQSIKGTATSCTTVGTLIVTIMFAVAFTVPGGTDSATGLPMFMHKKLFRVFILSDTISLISSATSVITFLGLLTSTYAEDDFLRSLPTKMMIGLSTLFISIAAMMITFSCALTIMLDGEAKMIVPVIMFAGVPVVSFALYLFPLLFEICISTYRPSMFLKKAGS